jgi:hypothetical protein
MDVALAIFHDLRQRGFSAAEILALAANLIGLVTESMRVPPETGGSDAQLVGQPGAATPSGDPGDRGPTK